MVELLLVLLFALYDDVCAAARTGDVARLMMAKPTSTANTR